MKAMGKGSISSALLLALNVAWYGGSLILAIAVVLAAASPFVDFSGGEIDIPVSFSVDSVALAVTAPDLGVQNAQLEDARGQLKFPVQHAGGIVAPTLVFVVVMLVFVLWVLAQLRAVFRTFRDGQPFAAANARRIRWIGYAVILGQLARAGAVFTSNYYAMTHFSAPGLRFDIKPDIDVYAIVHGLIILVIAEVFRTGARLDEEQSLTV